MKKTAIHIHALTLTVHLGWAKEERDQPQKVSVDISLEFKSPPAACLTDELADTLCYDQLIAIIKKYTDTKEFRLVEHLGYKLYELIKASAPPESQIMIRLAKHPAIRDLTGGVTFCYGDAL